MPDGPAVIADRELCMGTGTCMVYAPGTFDLDETGKVVVRDPITDDPDAVRAAVEACPTRALFFRDDP